MKLRNIAGFLAASALMVSAATAQAETYVLLVGVCDYPTPVDAAGKPLKNAEGAIVDNDLSGAINDMTSVKDVLTSGFGVKTNNVKMLTDKAATSENLIKELKWLIGSAKAGDQVFFGFSGHGASIPVDGSLEEDGKEEVIVLGDDSLVPDDFFGELKDALSTAGINATYFFDSCHSGGMSRDTFKGKAKFIPMSKLSKRAKMMGAKQFRSAFGANAKSGNLKAGGYNTNQPALAGETEKNMKSAGKGEYAFLFSSKEDQTSIDAKIDGFPAHGLFTLAFTEVLKSEAKFPLGDLMSGIQSFFTENEIPQSPMFEFSSEARSGLPFIL